MIKVFVILDAKNLISRFSEFFSVSFEDNLPFTLPLLCFGEKNCHDISVRILSLLPSLALKWTYQIYKEEKV